MNITEYTPATALGRQLRDALIRHFVGRAAELRAFQAALTERADVFTVLYLHGPGGIGKSTLMQRFADEAHRSGRPVQRLQPVPDHAPAMTGSGHGDTGPDGTDPDRPPVILIDALERWEHPEHWVRNTVLPGCPVGTLVVVASRRPPSVAWRAELGWNDVLVPLAVGPLSPAESAGLLAAHNVPDERRAAALEFGSGNPLALRVAAQAIGGDPAGRSDDDRYRDVALSIYDQLIGPVPSRAHRHALEVSAHAASTDEDLLRSAVPRADAAELFDWLRDLPFVASGPRGLFPSGVVRNVVETELRWRDGDQFAGMHARVKDHLVKRARTVTADAVIPFVADIIFVQRGETRQWPFFTRIDGFEVREDRYAPADLSEVRAIAERAEGPDSARLVEYWLDRQPDAVRVYRRPGDDTVLGYFVLLRVNHPTEDDLGADPVVAAAWARTQNVMPLRPGEHVGVSRFVVDPASYHRPSEIMDLAQLRLAANILCDDELTWSVIVTPDPRFWAPSIERDHTMTDGPPIVVDGRAYTLYSQYWGLTPISAWSAVSDGQMLSRRPAAMPAGSRSAAWTRAEFDQAVRGTLRSWQRPDVLADSRMAHSRMVAELGAGDAVANLRRIFSAALETLRGDPRQTKFHRVLMATFFDGVPTQEAAAERLDLPYSTYRRHLARGLDGLCAMLWKAETHGVSFLEA
jgi:hypothetical protein